MTLDDLPLIDKAWTNRPPQKIEDAIAFIVREGLPQWRLIRQLFNALIGNLNDGTLQIFGVLIRFGDGVPSSADPNGSFYVRVDPPTATTWLYYRFADSWTLFSGSGAGVTSVTAGAGLVNSGTAADPIVDAVAGDATIVVGADSLKVGIISEANVDATIVTEASLDESVDLLGQLVEAAEAEVAILISIDANLASYTNTLPVDL